MCQSRPQLADVRYLQVAAEHAADLKSQSLDALGLFPGARVLDVGCGPGHDVHVLAGARTCRGVGVDIDLPMLRLARLATAPGGKAAFMCADATRLPFSDSTFDGVRSERMLQHLPDPASAVTEMIRVIRPEGRLVLIDTDWASLTIEGIGAQATGQMLKDVLLRQIAVSPTAGSDLPAYAVHHDIRVLKVSHITFTTRDAALLRLITHLDKVENTASATGLVDAADLTAWRESLTSASRCGTLHASLTLSMMLAVKEQSPSSEPDRPLSYPNK